MEDQARRWALQAGDSQAAREGADPPDPKPAGAWGPDRVPLRFSCSLSSVAKPGPGIPLRRRCPKARPPWSSWGPHGRTVPLTRHWLHSSKEIGSPSTVDSEVLRASKTLGTVAN